MKFLESMEIYWKSRLQKIFNIEVSHGSFVAETNLFSCDISAINLRAICVHQNVCQFVKSCINAL